MSRPALLARSLSLIPTHGFTRLALSLSSTPSLSESAITALFGQGEEAERTLVQEWLEEGRKDMRRFALEQKGWEGKEERERVYELLRRRLRWNEPVLEYLPDALALISSPSFTPPFSLPLPLTIPRFRPLPGLKHVTSIADEAAWLLSPSSPSPTKQSASPSSSSFTSSSDMATYYLSRARLSTVYAVAEMHQLSSTPARSDKFLEDLVGLTSGAKELGKEVGQFSEFVGRGWGGIIRSWGI